MTNIPLTDMTVTKRESQGGKAEEAGEGDQQVEEPKVLMTLKRGKSNNPYHVFRYLYIFIRMTINEMKPIWFKKNSRFQVRHKLSLCPLGRADIADQRLFWIV